MPNNDVISTLMAQNLIECIARHVAFVSDVWCYFFFSVYIVVYTPV